MKKSEEKMKRFTSRDCDNLNCEICSRRHVHCNDSSDCSDELQERLKAYEDKAEAESKSKENIPLNEIFKWRLDDGTLLYMFLYREETNGYLCAHREITYADAEMALRKIEGKTE